MSASLDELKQALLETLENRGVLGQVKAKVRAEIFAALDDEHAQRPELPRENAVINELIREYFEYNGYHHSLSVMLPESGHPEERQFNRPFLADELRLQEDERSRSLPLIYALVGGLRSTTELPELGQAGGLSSATDHPAASPSLVAPPYVGTSRAASGEVRASVVPEGLAGLLDAEEPGLMVIRGGAPTGGRS